MNNGNKQEDAMLLNIDLKLRLICPYLFFFSLLFSHLLQFVSRTLFKCTVMLGSNYLFLQMTAIVALLERSFCEKYILSKQSCHGLCCRREKRRGMK